MSAVRTPKTVPAATKLLERHADLTARVTAVEAERATRIANANAWADSAAEPMVAELAAIAAAIEPWWTQSGAQLARGKKSLQLGGCFIGTRLSRPKLTHSFENDDKAVEALMKTRYRRQATRVSYSLDRTGTLKLLQLQGKAADELAGLGFAIDQSDNFFVERAEQAATIAP